MAQLRNFAKLDPTKTLFLLCDVQESFAKVVPLFGNLVQNVSKLVRCGQYMEVPLIATEQYPKGLGKTVNDINISHAMAIIPKTSFSLFVPEFLCYLEELLPQKPEDMVLFGVETHVCVLQSGADLLENNFKVHIVADCCASRTNQDRDISLNLLRDIGCFIQTSESVIFSLLQGKDNPNFKQVSKAIADPSTNMQLETFCTHSAPPSKTTPKAAKAPPKKPAPPKPKPTPKAAPSKTSAQAAAPAPAPAPVPAPAPAKPAPKGMTKIVSPAPPKPKPAPPKPSPKPAPKVALPKPVIAKSAPKVNVAKPAVSKPKKSVPKKMAKK